MDFSTFLLVVVLFSLVFWFVLHRLSESTDSWQHLAGRINKLETERKSLVERVHAMEARLKELAQQPAARPPEPPGSQLAEPVMHSSPVSPAPPPTPVIPVEAARIEAPAPTAASFRASQPKPETPPPVTPSYEPEPAKPDMPGAVYTAAGPPAPDHTPASKPPAVIPPPPVVPPAAETPRHVIKLEQPRPELPKPLVPAKPLPPPGAPPTLEARPSFYPLISEPVRPPRPALSARLKALLNLEEVLGTNYLSKLGVIFVVIGMALYLGYQLQRQGPAFRVVLGYTVSFLMLGAGMFFERRERYRVLARAR